MGTRDLLETNVRAAQATLTEAERRFLAVSMARYGSEYWGMCYACNGACRHGIAVPDVLRALAGVYCEAGE